MYGAADMTLQRPKAQQQPSYMPDAPEQRGNPQTFAQMRAAGMARPAPQAAVPQAARQAIASNVANPSAYGAPQAVDTFNRLNAALSEQFGLARRNVDQQAARRGLFDSSVAVGQLGDLATQQARAQSELAGQIAEKAALSQQSDRASAINQALQLGQMDQSAGQFDMQQALAQALGLGGLDLQRNQLAQSGRQFDASLGLQRDQLSQQGRQFDANQQLQRDQLLQQLAMFFGLPTGAYSPEAGMDAQYGGGETYGPDGITYTASNLTPPIYSMPEGYL